MNSWAWIVLMICGWLAGTVSGAAGFGGAIVLLPALALALGPREAVPVLTVAQLCGNLARACLGRREIRWRPALLFAAGAIPACAVGSRLFVGLPAGALGRGIGVLLLALLVFRRLGTRRPIPEPGLPPAGALVGLLSALAGSAGPLGAAVFLGLDLPARAYVATEAVTAALVHLTKGLVYGRYAALTATDLARGLALGAALVAGAWTGRALIDHLPAGAIARLIEGLMAISATLLILGIG